MYILYNMYYLFFMYVLPQILKKDLNNILEGRIVMNHIFLNQSLFKSTTIK